MESNLNTSNASDSSNTVQKDKNLFGSIGFGLALFTTLLFNMADLAIIACILCIIGLFKKPRLLAIIGICIVAFDLIVLKPSLMILLLF